ncbi:MAG: dihydrodipicolinate synthase family protein, partial [Oscillospiraceae bacterium]|nr:dihydrodipicolinate synthase family protein [Oscillospiraceae bacterium]
ALAHGRLAMYSGNDDHIVPVLAMGGEGIVSVVSNIAPRLVGDLCRAWFAGDTAKAAELQRKIQPLSDSLFCEVNPIPVKAAMAMLGHCANTLRSPLTQMEEENVVRLRNEMKKLALL